MIGTVLLAGAVWLVFNVLFGACFIYPSCVIATSTPCIAASQRTV